jgi:hypothetical protein
MNRWILFAALFVVVLGGAFLLDQTLGWNTVGVTAGLGAGVGAWLGISAGNKRARETDAYRERWLSKRAKSQQKDDGA